MSRLLNDFNQSLHKGFIDKHISHKGNYTPKLLVNNKNGKVLSTIIDELQKCETFYFSVAFITESGLASLKAQLLDLSNKGVKGKILTSNYLGFNSPKMYGELLKLKNVEVRLTDIAGFHAKGYIFEHKDYSSMVIGSSNLTSNALKVNYEHNVLLSTMKNGDLVDSVKSEFDLLWQKSTPLTEQWINSYKESFEYRSLEKLAEVEQTQMLLADKVKKSVEIVPNLMQAEALRSLKAIRDKAKDKALIISATGTGKTILCALDVREVNPNKFLFIVHNEGILNRAKEEFKKVLPIKNDSDFGLLTGKHRDVDAKYLFATIQTLSRDDNFKQFDENEFDYIVFDEAHRSAASTYQRVFNYFKPKFMLGMTATPERSDELSIFELFDYNIAYEIRLQAALESDILCPFHYFGVTDYVHQGIKEDDVTKLRYLTSDERVNYIIQKTDYYGYSGEILQGLIFVSSKKEAYDLADKLSSKGNKNGSSVIMGYMIKSQEMPIFITYDKHEDISDSTKYEDEFLSQDELKWFTKSNRTLESKEVQKILSHRAKGIKMYIFVQKKDDDGIYFYYLGTAGYIEGSEKQDKMPNGSNVVTMDLALDKAVRDDIYRYLTN
ncbi:TPA: DUF3427 domain-containing protein [Staphylococcus aureus]